MSSSRLALVLAFILLGALPSQALAGTPAVGFHRVAIDSGVTFPDLSRTAQRHGYIVLHAWQTSTMRQLKAANPNLKVLVYKNLSTTVSYHASDPFQPTGVRYDDANANRPEWFLKDTSGQRIQFRSYPGLWQMDIGSPEYQRRWADNVVAEITREGWDGVAMDDANPTIKYHFDPDRVAKYPNDATFGAAMRSMLAHAGPRIQSAGKLAIPNICCTSELGVDIWSDWLQFVSGSFEENFTKWGTQTGEGTKWDWGSTGWSAHLQQGVEAARQNKIFLAGTKSQPTDVAAMRYGLATLMLSAEGRSSLTFGPDNATETWFPEYEMNLGEPTEGYRRTGAVYSRKYTNGLVVVNPSQSTQEVPLGGTFSGSGLTRASSASMPPTSGLILERVDGPASPGTPPTESPVQATPDAEAPQPARAEEPRRSENEPSTGASGPAPVEEPTPAGQPALKPVTRGAPRCAKASVRSPSARRRCIRASRRARARARARVRDASRPSRGAVAAHGAAAGPSAP